MVNDNKDREEYLEQKRRRNITMGILGVCLVIMVVGSFWVGGNYACKSAGGEVTKMFPPRCADVEVVAACSELNMIFAINPRALECLNNETGNN